MSLSHGEAIYTVGGNIHFEGAHRRGAPFSCHHLKGELSNGGFYFGREEY